MRKLDEVTSAIMHERFGRDNIIALATAEGCNPAVRYVNAFYEDGAFYVITWAESNKMQQLAENSAVSIAGDWFTARGEGENLGWFGSEQNRALAGKLRNAFSEWIDNGHNDFSSQSTIILKIRLISGVLFSHGTRYEIGFT